MNTITESVINKFVELFGTSPSLIVRSPGGKYYWRAFRL